ncbi:hypothetical protein [Streptomyces sp. NRRL B-24484]|uniref:hypothetical protein n=1 Tax=Streptomyces sp. NRRL B-24484 TaxID=1463833 RepID=UPI0004BFDF64|nr:hypothetical protein [Streptomyces sp. NRRL B-24484]
MIGSFLAFAVIPAIVAGLARWAAVRRRRALAEGRPVHFRCRLDGRRGRLLADPRLDGPVFLDRTGTATALPHGGEVLDATLTRVTGAAVEKVGLRYRTPGGTVLTLALATRDARTVGAWLAGPPRPAPAARPPRPAAPVWAVTALTAALLTGLAAADVALLGDRTTAEVLAVDHDYGNCTVGWDAGAQQADVDCDTSHLRPADHLPVIALLWPFLGEAVDTRTMPTVAAVAGGGLGLLGLTGSLLTTPLACTRRVRRALRTRSVPPPPPTAGPGDDTPEEWPALEGGLNHANLAAAARHADRHHPGARVAPPRRGPGRTSVPPRRWAAATALGTGAWVLLTLSVGGLLDDHFHLGHWRFLVFGTAGIAAVARIGWFAADRSSLWRPVLRAARSDAADGAWQPMRYVRLRETTGAMALVLFRPEGEDAAAPVYVQPISGSRSTGGSTIGGPPPVGDALVHDTGAGPLVCEIDGIRYLPAGRATVAAADPERTRREILRYAESHVRPTGRG